MQHALKSQGRLTAIKAYCGERHILKPVRLYQKFVLCFFSNFDELDIAWHNITKCFMLMQVSSIKGKGQIRKLSFVR